MPPMIPLFISYFYPPAGGSGLPGSQRTVKFIRYLRAVEKSYVLTLEPQGYPQGMLLNFTPSLPIRNEVIVRTPVKDQFARVMQLRTVLQRRASQEAENLPDTSSEVTPEVEAEGKFTRSPLQRFKDFVYHSYYFPDQIAAPWLRPAVKAGVRLVRANNINIIFATGMPWTALVVGRMVAAKTGVPFIADFRDPWLGNPFLESKGWLLDQRERLCEQKVVEQAALVTANTVPLQEEFIRRYPQVGAEKIISLPNGYDIGDFHHLSGLQADENGESKKLVLIHAGFLYGKRDPAPLFDALELLLQKNPELADQVAFHQYGGLSVSYDVEQRYARLFDQGIVRLFGQVPFDECLKKLLQADILVIIQPGTKTQVPSKLYDYLCINRPVFTITPPDGALGVMIREEGFGDLFSPYETEALTARLRDLCLLKLENRLPRTADYPNRDKFDVRHIARTLEEQMLRIVSSAG